MLKETQNRLKILKQTFYKSLTDLCHVYKCILNIMKLVMLPTDL